MSFETGVGISGKPRPEPTSNTALEDAVSINGLQPVLAKVTFAERSAMLEQPEKSLPEYPLFAFHNPGVRTFERMKWLRPSNLIEADYIEG